jgi:hypothetical protein
MEFPKISFKGKVAFRDAEDFTWIKGVFWIKKA